MIVLSTRSTASRSDNTISAAGLSRTAAARLRNGRMRKRMVGRPTHLSSSEQGWLDLQQIATVEVTSEDPNFPIDSAFASDDDVGWRASQRGEQLIRVIFDQAVSVRRIRLHLREAKL